MHNGDYTNHLPGAEFVVNRLGKSLGQHPAKVAIHRRKQVRVAFDEQKSGIYRPDEFFVQARRLVFIPVMSFGQIRSGCRDNAKLSSQSLINGVGVRRGLRSKGKAKKESGRVLLYFRVIL
jgi:hypothetical protein